MAMTMSKGLHKEPSLKAQLELLMTDILIYVAAKATYVRLLHGKIGFFGFFSALAP